MCLEMFYILQGYGNSWLVREREDGTWEETPIADYHLVSFNDNLFEEYVPKLKWQGERHKLQEFIKEEKNFSLIPLKLRTKTLIEEKVRNLEYPH